MREPDPKSLHLIRQVVLALARGEQPPHDMNVLPAIDYAYAETKPYAREGGYPGLVLTAKGMEAAAMWRSAN